MVFLAISTYQSYVAIFLILAVAYIYLEYEASGVHKRSRAFASYLKMLLVAGIPAFLNIAIVKLYVYIQNMKNAAQIAQGKAQAVSEVKEVSTSTGIVHRLYLVCARLSVLCSS